ncbi:transporter [Hymenobacter sp. BT730]|uniref:transporter n=1 Tax=Hymenobacter sp. BT730 TaxID=3063332 RepID=UPI0026DFD92F|nr:transporter [Hymenobacter sp. BT730]
MYRFVPTLSLLLAGLAAAPLASAQSFPEKPTADSLHVLKRGYTLTQPTPENLLRPLSTDRPDATESPYSVDAGHFQFETDLVRFNRLREDGQLQKQEIALNHINLKLGISRTTDVQAVVETYTWQKTKNQDGVQRQHGFGDLTLRLKRNLWGNEGGLTSFALMPFVKLPTGSVGSGKVEGGLVTPFAWQLPADWNLGAQLKATLTHDEETEQGFLELAPSLTASHKIYRELAGFAEVASAWDTRNSHWMSTFDTGVTLGLSDNLQLDAGAYLPLTDGTEASWFLGVSFRR